MDSAICLKLCVCRIAVKILERRSDTAKVLAVLGANCTKLGLEIIGCELRNVVGKLNRLNVQLLADYRDKALVGSLICLNEHSRNRLTVLDSRRVTAGTAENNNVNYLLHILLKSLIDEGLIAYRVGAKVDGLGRGLINRANEISVNLLCHKGNVRSGKLRHGHKTGIKRHISVNLVLGHTLHPEALAASSYIPVGKLVNEALKHSGGLGNLIIFKKTVNLLNCGI